MCEGKKGCESEEGGWKNLSKNLENDNFTNLLLEILYFYILQKEHIPRDFVTYTLTPLVVCTLSLNLKRLNSDPKFPLMRKA